MGGTITLTKGGKNVTSDRVGQARLHLIGRDHYRCDWLEHSTLERNTKIVFCWDQPFLVNWVRFFVVYSGKGVSVGLVGHLNLPQTRM